jgi:alkylation response protein AidB-like acyl-CoA dehydrogenase
LDEYTTLSDSGEVAVVRSEVRAWLSENWDLELTLVQWREKLVDSGWGCPTWPRDWFGRGLSIGLADVVTEELEGAGAVGVTNVGIGMLLAAPAIIDHGSDDVKARFLRPIATSEVRWCELFSEPGSGSDLAGLTTRAEIDGDEWIVSGQKVWNTGALQADYGLLLARTDWTKSKNRGITCLILPMHQPGVEVRPLKQMNGHATFNEVFLTEARIPRNNVIGATEAGWPIAQSVLSREREHGTSRAIDPARLDSRSLAVREAAVEMDEHQDTYRWYPQRAGRPDLLISQARALGVQSDPLIRQRIAGAVAFERASGWNKERARSARAAGKAPGPEGSLAKLSGTELARMAAGIHADMAGAHAMLSGPDSLLNGIISEVIVSVPAGSIAGGTDEIQRNLVGERVLKLPREPAVDVGVPFEEVQKKRNDSTRGTEW